MPPPDDPATSPTRIARSAVVVLAVYGLARALLAARVVLLLGFLSVVLATVLCFPIDRLSRRVPRWGAVLLTLVVFALAVALVVWGLAPVVERQVADLPDQLEHALVAVRRFWTRTGGAPNDVSEAVTRHAPATVARALPVASTALEVATSAVLVVVLAFFLASERDRLHEGMRRLLPAEHAAPFDTWWTRTGTALRHWTGGILVSMTVMGTFTGVGLHLAGIDDAFALALITFLGTFVPYAGAIASAVPGLAVAFLQSPHHFLLALAVYVAVHHVEGYLVQPLVMRRAVRLSPPILLLWQAAAVVVLGIPGVIVATPLLACVQVAVDLFWQERLAKSHPSPATP